MNCRALTFSDAQLVTRSLPLAALTSLRSLTVTSSMSRAGPYRLLLQAKDPKLCEGGVSHRSVMRSVPRAVATGLQFYSTLKA